MSHLQRLHVPLQRLAKACQKFTSSPSVDLPNVPGIAEKAVDVTLPLADLTVEEDVATDRIARMAVLGRPPTDARQSADRLPPAHLQGRRCTGGFFCLLLYLAIPRGRTFETLE